MKTDAGGLKDISECQGQKEEGQKMVEIELIINGKKERVSFGKFKELLFNEPKKIESIDVNIINGVDVYNYIKDYGKPMCDEFIEYWTETTTRGSKKRWKTEKVFDVSRRIKTWARKDYNGLYSNYCVEKKRLEDLEEERQAKDNSDPEEFKKFMSEITKGLIRKMSVNEKM